MLPIINLVQLFFYHVFSRERVYLISSSNSSCIVTFLVNFSFLDSLLVVLHFVFFQKLLEVNLMIMLCLYQLRLFAIVPINSEIFESNVIHKVWKKPWQSGGSKMKTVYRSPLKESIK